MNDNPDTVHVATYANANADADAHLAPLKIGVFGGSFNPVHLGHTLLAITTQQTKPIDTLLMVPVFKHVSKKNLLPFDDRVSMCELAIEPFAASAGGGKVEVCTIEREVGESNAPMLRAIRRKYSTDPSRKVELYWICGDDVFRWIEKPKGLETMAEVAGLIVQRRLHKSSATDRFYKDPLDDDRTRQIAARLNVTISFIYGELPHFSSTLVRNTPGAWRSFLPQSVAKYLESKPELLAQLHDNLEADAKKEAQHIATGMPPLKRQRLESTASANRAAECILRALDVVHSLQFERGHTGLLLSIGSDYVKEGLRTSQANTDAVIGKINAVEEDEFDGFDEAWALACELRQIPVWLHRDRAVVDKRYVMLKDLQGQDGWAARYSLASKFNPRIDVIMSSIIRSLQEIIDVGKQGSGHKTSSLEDAPVLLSTWFDGKEALGRLRAFVCSGGPNAPCIIKDSLNMRQLLHQMIDAKERRIGRVVSLHENGTSSTDNSLPQFGASDALRRMLDEISSWEWLLLGSFAPSTPLPLIHKLLSKGDVSGSATARQFDVQGFFAAASAAIDLMLNETKALAAFGCARA